MSSNKNNEMTNYLLCKKPETGVSGSQTATRVTVGETHLRSVQLSAEFFASDDFLATLRLGRDSTNGRLGIIESSYRIGDSVTPNIRPEFCKRESQIQAHDLLAKVRAGFSSPARAQIQVAGGDLQLLSECLSLGRGRNLEVGFEVHCSMIDQFDLVVHIFLHVDQNDRRDYPDNYENL
jgi:hypothetical protein